MTEADILATTYYHKAIVERPIPVKRGRFDDYELSTVYNNLPCAVSFTKGSDIGESDTVQAIEYVAELFCRPEITIKAGDEITADVHGQVFCFKAGEGVRYVSHIAVPLIRSDRA